MNLGEHIWDINGSRQDLFQTYPNIQVHMHVHQIWRCVIRSNALKLKEGQGNWSGSYHRNTNSTCLQGVSMKGSWMAGVRIRMALAPGHEAGVTGTIARRRHEPGNHVRREGATHIDSANPFCLLVSSECSPFFTYGRFFAGVWFI